MKIPHISETHTLQDILDEPFHTFDTEEAVSYDNTPYGFLQITPIGKAFLSSESTSSHILLQGLYRKHCDTCDFEETFRPNEDTIATLDDLSYSILRTGVQPIPIQVRYPLDSMLVYFFPTNREASGRSAPTLFNQLVDARERQSSIVTPEPYFATSYALGMQDYSTVPHYYEFIHDHPEEIDRLSSYIQRLNKNSPFKLNTGTMETQDELQALYSGKEPVDTDMLDAALDVVSTDTISNVVIFSYHPEKEKDEERYRIGITSLL